MEPWESAGAEAVSFIGRQGPVCGAHALGYLAPELQRRPSRPAVSPCLERGCSTDCGEALTAGKLMVQLRLFFVPGACWLGSAAPSVT